METRSINSNEYIFTSSALDWSPGLIVEQVNFTTSELENLAEILRTNRIVEITFRECIFPDDNFIDVLSKSSTLKRVDLANNPLTFEQGLGVLVLGNQLTHLNLSNTVDFFDRYVEHAKSYPHPAPLPAEIIVLDRQEKEMRADFEEARNKPAPSVWSFFTSVTAPRQVGFMDIMQVATEIREIAEMQCAVFWLSAGAMLGKTQTLQHLDLSNNIATINGRNQLGKVCMQKIAPGLEVNRTLKSLALGQNDLVHHSLTVMADALIKNKKIPLETLDLSGNQIRYDSDHPTGSLEKLLAQPHCSIQTLVLSQEIPFPLSEICEAVASNPQSKLTNITAKFTLLTGPILPLVLRESDAAIAKLHETNANIMITTNHEEKEALRLTRSKRNPTISR